LKILKAARGKPALFKEIRSIAAILPKIVKPEETL
jgi:hypothetical protein